LLADRSALQAQTALLLLLLPYYYCCY